MLKWSILILIIAIFIGFRFFYVPYTVKNDWAWYEFEQLKVPSSPNFYLLCPEEQCKNVAEHGQSPVFHYGINKLKEKWGKMIAQQPRTHLLGTRQNQLAYVQYSAFWHFPDFIDVKFIQLGKDKSTLMIMSRSVFGHSDFGVNKKRVQSWVQALMNHNISLLD